MNYITPTKHIDKKDYEYIVSLGNKCPTLMSLRSIECYKESFPFDSIPTTPALILKYLKDTTEFFPQRKIIQNKDGVWFGHFDLDKDYENTIDTFKRRFERLYTILKEKKKILFVYTSAADIYNEMGNRYNDNYGGLCKIKEYIQDTYNYNNFTILAIHTNKSYNDTENIINFTINVEDKYLSDDMSTHIPEVTTKYRHVLCQLLKEIIR